ncbi:MAG: hypothetical protein WA664_15490 [Candidatus Acidiferrales bacterium]
MPVPPKPALRQIRPKSAGTKERDEERRAMRDIVFAACTIGFFVVAIAYVWGCERLK